MKVAIVNQSLDRILPPFQTSVGLCTYRLARALAPFCEVVVYGVSGTAAPLEVGQELQEEGVCYRFISPTLSDKVIGKIFKRYAKSPLGRYFNQGFKPAPSVSAWTAPLYGRKIAQDMQLQDFDVVHFQHTSQYIPLVKRLNPQTKVVLQLHAEWFPQHNQPLLRRRLKNVDLVATVSDYITEKTRTDFAELNDRCSTIYNGIDGSEFATEKDYVALRNRQEKKILYVGAISPHKGIHVLIEAFKIIAQQHPNACLQLAGPQWPYPLEETFAMNNTELIAKVSPYYAFDYMTLLRGMIPPELVDQVSFLGAIPRLQLIEAFYEADVFVFPSIWDEGFGLPPLEAMASGTPVVAAQSGALAEVVQDGQQGFLVEKNDPVGLATKIIEILVNDDLKESLGKAARARALKQFTWNQAAAVALRYYHALMQ
ncbi:MAG TPA: glycosyltransferase family 4 protein [Stenomitos sp.]